MNTTFKSLLKDVIPPVLLRQIVAAKHGRAFQGRFTNWADAEAQSSGYEDAAILEKTKNSLLEVKSGRAKFARDSVVFHESEYPYPLLTVLLRAALENGGKLSVLDFGGSLGNTYFHCKDLLASVRELRWSIVEQPNHVACGKQFFADSQLHFYNTVEECLREQKPNVILLSSVLQYLASPYTVLGELLEHKIPNLIVDRTPFAVDGKEFLTVQVVPPHIYSASYPIWVFDKQKFLDTIRKEYELIDEFPAIDDLDPSAHYAGFIFRAAPHRSIIS